MSAPAAQANTTTFRRTEECGPGVVTQTVENAVHGESYDDPEDSTKVYNIQGFDAAPRGQWHIIPPRVVKPNPMIETEAVRVQLAKVADSAVAQTGKFHYKTWFEGREGRRLLEYDNADSLEDERDPYFVEVQRYLPDAPGVEIIVTTRSQTATGMPSSQR
ncbi:hypothetical protein LTR35_017521 [Friedmanniomyces endolithicus]|nr:hypothetical protein LTR35_017521 [Friedmanniomyces endolithicus]KAK0268707.1 hypothetical protein LTS00_017485 [Friedmanniomyces endolithicus]